MEIGIWCQTDRGLKRESNQDSYLVDKGLGLFIVADGMGGHSGGEVASSIAVETMQEVVAKSTDGESPRDLLKRAYAEASHRIYDRSLREAEKLSGMGTTMVTAYFKSPLLYLANVGDSRAYMFKLPNYWQLTEDHSLINEQIRAGLLTVDQARNFVGKNVITRSVGYERDIECDIIEREVHPGECFLLCSDGLSGLVTDDKISEIIAKNPPKDVVKKCIDEAKKNGGDDNVTVLFIQFLEGPE